MSGSGTALVATLGHAWLRDQAFGMEVLRRLRDEGVPPGVELTDWSFGTITAFQKLSARRFDRAVFLSGTARGRPPGTLHRFSPPPELPPPEEIHARVADSVMGMVSVDNLVILGRYYGALPEHVVLIEAEPVDEGWGDRLSPAVERLVTPAAAAVREELARPLARVGARRG